MASEGTFRMKIKFYLKTPSENNGHAPSPCPSTSYKDLVKRQNYLYLVMGIFPKQTPH